MPLTQWDVHLLYTQQTNPPKRKYVVVAHSGDGWFYGLFINSVVHEFVRLRPNLQVCMAQIPATTHSFLRYDSWVDCTVVSTFRQADAVNPVGRVHPEMVPLIRAAVAACPRLLPGQKRTILG